MSRVIAIGIGCFLMKDDAIGVKVMEFIKERLSEKGILVIIGETDFQFCLRLINDDDLLFITDAVQSGEKPGKITVLTLIEAIEKRSQLYAQHDMSFFDLIAMYIPNIKGYLIGVEASEVFLGLELSDPLNENFETICKEVEGIILSKLQEHRQIPL